MKATWFNLTETVNHIIERVFELTERVSELEEDSNNEYNIPTTDPGDGLTIWNDNGTLKVSVNSGD